jgi:IclR family transcriptional regulator, KDG regulon repressor
MKAAKEQAGVPALQRGLTLLEMIAQNRSPLGFNQFVQELKLPKASVSRLLKVLRDRGYVVKDEKSGTYSPGIRMSILGGSQTTALTLRREAELLLPALVDAVHNTAIVILWTGEYMQCLARGLYESSIPMQEPGNITTDLSRYPWGWLFFKTLPKAEQARAMARFQDATLFNKRLLERMKRFQDLGYLYDNQEIFPHVRRLGVPVFDGTGKIVGAAGIGGNPLSLPDSKVRSFGLKLKEFAAHLSAQLGWRRTSD